MGMLSVRLQTTLQKQDGVSLAELALSITIIGMILAATLGGYTLVHSAQLRNVATELTQINDAMTEFEKQYGYMPGDIPTASSYWSAESNGDGNGYILLGDATTREDLWVWRHLVAAELYKGSYAGTVVSGALRYGINTNAPGSSSFGDGVYGVYSHTTALYSTKGALIRFAALDSDGYPYSALLNAKDAYSVDLKLDDGVAATGKLYAFHASGVTGCVDDVLTAATASYILTNTTKDCQLGYWYRKF